MGKGTRILIGVLAGALTAVVLLLAVFVIGALLAFLELSALMSAQMSAIAANPNAYVSTPAQIITASSASGVTVYQSGSFGSERPFWDLLVYPGLAGLGGLIAAIVTYHLLAR